MLKIYLAQNQVIFQVVGNFEISSKTDKNELNANDALTYTIKLNWNW